MCVCVGAKVVKIEIKCVPIRAVVGRRAKLEVCMYVCRRIDKKVINNTGLFRISVFLFPLLKRRCETL